MWWTFPLIPFLTHILLPPHKKDLYNYYENAVIYTFHLHIYVLYLSVYLLAMYMLKAIKPTAICYIYLLPWNYVQI